MPEPREPLRSWSDPPRRPSVPGDLGATAICYVCAEPVLISHEQARLWRGAYFHDPCLSRHLGEETFTFSYCQCAEPARLDGIQALCGGCGRRL